MDKNKSRYELCGLKVLNFSFALGLSAGRRKEDQTEPNSNIYIDVLETQSEISSEVEAAATTFTGPLTSFSGSRLSRLLSLETGAIVLEH